MQKYNVGGQPGDEWRSNPGVEPRDQHERAQEIDTDVNQHVEHFHDRIAHAQGSLHHLGGDAPGEFVLVETKTLAQQVAMRHPANAHRVVADYGLMLEQRGE